MSLGVNLSSPDIRTGYDAVLDGKKDYMVLTYEKASNDLRVQVLEKGDLDYLSEEFSDGRIQYAFARVIDPNSKLPKFVLINWCGEGVPENRKGLFASHSTAVAQFLKGYHVSIQARSEGDIDPALIMKRVMASSGSNYGAGGDAANTQRGGPISAVGSSYKPVGTPDIKGMQAGARKETIAPVGSAYKPADLSNIRSTPASSNPPLAPRPVAAASKPPTMAPKPAPVVSAPPAVIPSAPRPEPVAPAASKVDDDDKIKPVGTAYQPVKLAAPGKLGSRASAFQQQGQQQTTPASGRVVSTGTPGKLTWSQRQELKKEREEEDRKANEAMVPSVRGPQPTAPPSNPPVPVNAAAPPSPKLEPVSQVTQDLGAAKLEDGGNTAAAAAQGEKAKVIYDYSAAEDNEISLVEGDTLTGIQQIDEGWWSGITPQGLQGLFPASCKCRGRVEKVVSFTD